MNESRGYSMPLPIKIWQRASAGIVWLIQAVFCLVYALPEVQALVNLKDSEWIALRITVVLTAPVFPVVGLTCFAKLHILPQGVSLTLFGLPLRQVPAEKIRVLSAVRYSSKLDAVDQIALCVRPPEEGLYLYLRRRSGYFRVNLNLNRDILWLEWSPERLKLLRQMYSDVPWIDGSPDKRFDNQL